MLLIVARGMVSATQRIPINAAGKSYAERSPDLVAAAKALQAERPRLSLHKIADRLPEQGYTLKGRPYAMSVRGMLQRRA